mmetsp:Transcript_6424/g.14054  ORF Transcript_6424/g.14054 Transcript_6424/m.14054 type:complete len:410 (+) Transcript_6424:34-1263(+)
MVAQSRTFSNSFSTAALFPRSASKTLKDGARRAAGATACGRFSTKSRSSKAGCGFMPRRRKPSLDSTEWHADITKLDDAADAKTDPVGSRMMDSVSTAASQSPSPAHKQLLRVFNAVLFIVRLQRAVSSSGGGSGKLKIEVPIGDSRGLATPGSAKSPNLKAAGGSQPATPGQSAMGKAGSTANGSMGKSWSLWSTRSGKTPISPASVLSRLPTPTSSRRMGETRSFTSPKAANLLAMLSSASRNVAGQASKSPASTTGQQDLDEEEHDGTPSFSGDWVCVGTWGLEDFLKKIGTPYMQRKLALSAPWPSWEFRQTGNNFYFKNKGCLGDIVEEFVVGGPSYSMRDGRKQLLTCSATWLDGTLVIKRNGPQGEFQEERTIDPNGKTMHFVLRSLDGSGSSWGRTFERSS